MLLLGEKMILFYLENYISSLCILFRKISKKNPKNLIPWEKSIRIFKITQPLTKCYEASIFIYLWIKKKQKHFLKQIENHASNGEKNKFWKIEKFFLQKCQQKFLFVIHNIIFSSCWIIFSQGQTKSKKIIEKFSDFLLEKVSKKCPKNNKCDKKMVQKDFHTCQKSWELKQN